MFKVLNVTLSRCHCHDFLGKRPKSMNKGAQVDNATGLREEILKACEPYQVRPRT